MGVDKKDLTVSFNMTIGEEEISYEADVTVEIVCDSNYGADADGHRGEFRSWIEDVVINQVRIIDYKNTVLSILKEEDITDVMKSLIDDEVENADLSPEEPDMDDQSEEE